MLGQLERTMFTLWIQGHGHKKSVGLQHCPTCQVVVVSPDNQSRSNGLIGQVGDNQVGDFLLDRTFLNLKITFQIPSLDTIRLIFSQPCNNNNTPII